MIVKVLIALLDILVQVLSTPDNQESPLSSEHTHQQHLVRFIGPCRYYYDWDSWFSRGALFVLTGPAIGLAGPATIIAFIINAVITLFTAMGYAELGSAMPEAGSGYCGLEKDSKTKCLYKRMDGMVCPHCCWQFVFCGILDHFYLTY